MNVSPFICSSKLSRIQLSLHDLSDILCSSRTMRIFENDSLWKKVPGLGSGRELSFIITVLHSIAGSYPIIMTFAPVRHIVWLAFPAQATPVPCLQDTKYNTGNEKKKNVNHLFCVCLCSLDMNLNMNGRDEFSNFP